MARRARRQVAVDIGAGNLPTFLTSFVGRDEVIQSLTHLVSKNRLVTLVGPAGVGKTRVAIEAMQHMRTAWRDGTVLVDYSSVCNDNAATGPLAVALSLSPTEACTPEQQLTRYLAPRHLVLILDNCELISCPIAEMTDRLLRRCPQLHILITSRIRTGVEGEVVYTVPPLSIPADEQTRTVENASEHSAIALFTDRATASRPDFRLSAENVTTVVRICAALDGLPLAIELACARLRMLSLGDLEHRLEDRFSLLANGHTGRHNSLRSTINLSHRLLSSEEQRAFEQLTLFAGGFRLEAAAAVLGLQGERLLGVLGSLVDQSLLHISTDEDGATRYHMLESLRQFGYERLAESGDVPRVRTRHYVYFSGTARNAAAEFEVQATESWLGQLRQDYANFRAALTWGHVSADPSFPALAVALGAFWQFRGDPREGAHWVRTALRSAHIDRNVWFCLLRLGGIMAIYEDDMESARRLFSTLLDAASRHGDRLYVAHAHVALGNLSFFLGTYPGREVDAQEHYRQALEIYERVLYWRGCMAVLMNTSMMNVALGRSDIGRREAARALELCELTGNHVHRMSAIARLGMAALFGGDCDEASRHFALCVREASPQSNGANPFYIAVMGLAAVAALRGDYDRASHMHGATLAVADRQQVRSLLPTDFTGFHELQMRACRAVGAMRYAALVEAGRRLTDGEVRTLAQAATANRNSEELPLSERELEIVQLVAKGMTNREIATRLQLSWRTVDAHLDHVRNKLGIRRRTQIAHWLTTVGRGFYGVPGENKAAS